MTEIHDRIRDFWDADASTYDGTKSHAISDPVERAAWRRRRATEERARHGRKPFGGADLRAVRREAPAELVVDGFLGLQVRIAEQVEGGERTGGRRERQAGRRQLMLSQQADDQDEHRETADVHQV